MRIRPGFVLFTLALAGPVVAQQWELGGAGGIGLSKSLSVTGAGQSATTGFKPGVAFSAFVGQNLYRHLGGEFRYTFQFDDLKLSSGGTEVTFAGVSHAVEYNLVLERDREASVRPFVAAGGGVRFYRGTGAEHAVQPLMNIAVLTHTQQVKGMLSGGAGLKWQVSGRCVMRAEVRAMFTPAPTQLFAPTAPGARIGGWVTQVMPMLGLSVTF